MPVVTALGIILLIVGGLILVPAVSELQDVGQSLTAFGGGIAGVYGLSTGLMAAVVGTLAIAGLLALFLLLIRR